MSFDADSFLAAAVQGSNSTKVTPCPIGDFMGIIDDVRARQWQSKDGGKTGISLDVFWSVQDEGVKQFLGRPEVIVKQGVMLDTIGGGLDMAEGKNVALGRLREATGTNDGDFSFLQLKGQAAKISVEHRPVGEDTFAEVKKVGKL